MMSGRRWGGVAWIAAATTAHAQPATPDAELVARGEELARSGEFSRAIVAFKQADKLHASAANACRIGLAYTRRELWSQAELFFARCKDRATAADPPPPWLAAAETALTAKLAEIDAAPIDVRVDAPGALISISSFPPDEQFAPRAIHLSPGNYMIVARAPDREPAKVAVAVEARTAQIGAPLSPDVSDQLVGFNISDFATSVLVLPPTGAFEDLLYIGESSVARTVGDLDPSLGDTTFAGKYAMSKPVDYGDDKGREGRGRLAKDGHFYAITTRSGPYDLPVLDVPPTGDIVMYHLTPTSQVDDVAIADVGGAAALDAVALQSGTLGVYEDLELATDTATPADTIGDRDPLVGYDMLAVGNFHGDGQLEIYVASDVMPELRLACFHLAAALDPCEPE